MEAIEKLAAETQKSAAVADEAGRKEILNSLRDLQYSIEKPEDTMPRVIHLLFDMLGGSSSPLQVNEISSETGAEPNLLGTDELTSSTTSNTFLRQRFKLLFTTSPAYQALPDFLAAANYQNPIETHKAPFQKARNTDLHLWLWFHGLAHQTALTSSPSRKSVQTGPAEKAVFVDIRVASGQQCIEFQKRFPDIRGRTIFQDFAGEIEHATSQGLPDGIEAMVHDFYTPQIIKGFTTIQPQEITILYDTDTTIAELEEFNNNKADILIERQIFDSIEVYD
ncbi:hypothetical protein ACMFMF_007626 [Clarireedia jacksonii]